MSNGNEEMSISKLESGLAAAVGNASKTAAFLDTFPHGLSLHQWNLWAVAHLGAHMTHRALWQLGDGLANRPIGDQSSLFDVPTDHAMVVRELEEFLDKIRERIVGAAVSWEKRVAEENEAGPPDLTEPVSVAIFTAGSISFAELEARFGDADGVRGALDYLVGKGTVVSADEVYSPAGGDLAGLSGDELRAAYEAEVGKKAGKKNEATLRAAILDARRTAAEAD